MNPHRAHLVRRLRARLVRDGYPRLQMSLIVVLTGAAGFLASSLLLGLGMDGLWLRYLCAFAVAYPAFLLLLWLWLRTRTGDYFDGVDFPSSSFSSSGESSGTIELPLPARLPTPGGGHFGGGGASSRFEMPAIEATPASGGDSGGVGDVAGDALGAVGDADEFWIVVLVVIILLAVLAASGWMVYTAPDLFAEMTVDGALTGGLYRRLRKAEPGAWLETAVRRTWLPFALTAAIVVGAGWALQQQVPEAHTLAEAIAQLK